MKTLHQRLKAKYGNPQRVNLPSLSLPNGKSLWEMATVYLGDIDGVIVTEDNKSVYNTNHDGTSSSENADIYELMVVSGEKYYELKRYI